MTTIREPLHEVTITLKRLGRTSVKLEKAELERLHSDWKANRTSITDYKGLSWTGIDDFDRERIPTTICLCPSQIATLTVDGVDVPRLSVK